MTLENPEDPTMEAEAETEEPNNEIPNEKETTPSLRMPAAPGTAPETNG